MEDIVLLWTSFTLSYSYILFCFCFFSVSCYLATIKSNFEIHNFYILIILSKWETKLNGDELMNTGQLSRCSITCMKNQQGNQASTLRTF